MSDIVEQLREPAMTLGEIRWHSSIQLKAADEIERLREALRQIAHDDEDYRERVREYRDIARAALGEDK